MKNRSFLLLAVVTLMAFTGCQAKASICPASTGTPQYLTVPPDELPTPTPESNLASIPVEIGGKTINVNKIVEGPLCNGTWSGTVYVACDVQVYPWQDQPTFLKDCNLTIEPGTVVYVAYHNDSAYYKGCGCHTGEITGP
jgi:hypothetical protein